MQYYRLWIYSCNVVLGLTSAIFIIFAAFVVADVRLSLLEGVELYHPTFLYAYGALIVQCGVVQTIGCLGAKRLSHKLLSLYWTLLLLLTLGDFGVGLYWVFQLEKVKINLRPYLTKEFIEKYSTDEVFTQRWNKIQSQERCCGVDGPFDFEKFSTSQFHNSDQAAFSANSHLIVDVETGLLSLPESCCTLIYVPTTVSSSSSGGISLDKDYRVPHYPVKEEQSPFSQQPSDSSLNPDDDQPSDFAGGGRRGRTVINLPHKSDEPRTDLYDDDDDDVNDEVETDFYVDDGSNPPYQLNSSEFHEHSGVPDDHDIGHNDKIRLRKPNISDSGEVHKRDIIQSYEPLHAHKVRHELHRKTQFSSLIDVKLLKNSSIVLGKNTNITNGNYRRSTKNSTSSRNENNNIRKVNDEIVAASQTSGELQTPSRYKTNKLFPSISVKVRRDRRETRALSVTQVPAVSAPNPRRIFCHGQPEGLNHHNSYKKDLLDQRKTTASMQGDETSPSTQMASWPYPNIAGTTTSTFTTPTSLPVQDKSTESMDKVETNEMKELTKRQDEESLLAIRKSQRIMTSFADASSLPTPKLTFFSSSRKGRTSDGNQRYRQKRNAEMNGDNSGLTLQSDLFGISQSSAFTSEEVADRRKGKNSVVKSYFSPLSSSSTAVSSSTSFIEAISPHTAVVSSSATLSHDQWKESNESESRNNNNGNSSASGIQKRLYVYGQGCGVKLIEWVDHVSGIMFILGFCIIGFVKTCFLVILRTEIQEMIEKIHMIEPEEVLSPSRNSKDQRFLHVSHPLLQNPHRASTVSAHGVLLPTIKSPDGPSTTITGLGGYNRPNRHYLRRASNIVGGDRSRSHSNETVNMTLLMTSSHSESREKGRSNPNLPSSVGGSTGTIGNLEERDPVSGLSITVPNSSATSTSVTNAPRYLRRSSTCSSSTNPVNPYAHGFEGEPRAGPSSRFYQYFEPVYQTPHLYQTHHHLYTRNRPHARNMSCGAILPLTSSYRSNSAAAAALVASHRGARKFSIAPTSNTTANLGHTFSSKGKDENNELIISVSLEHIASSDQDEEVAEEEEKEQEKKDWAAATACVDNEVETKTTLEADDNVGTKLKTFTHTESANESNGGSGERELQRRNGNNNDLSNSLPMSYIGTAV